MLSLQYDNYYNQSNGFGLGDFNFEDESKLNLFQLQQHRQFIQQFQRPIQPKLDESKILAGKVIIIILRLSLIYNYIYIYINVLFLFINRT